MTSRSERKGVLPRQDIRALVADGHIRSSIDIPDRNIQPASLDLTLGDVAYRLRCSFLPGTSSVRDKLREYGMDELDLTDDGAVLEQNRPYLIPLRERLRLPAGIRGRTNPRSSTGRLDVFTRVITDEGAHFDEVRDGYAGELFLEVVPMSFTVKVRSGITLNQLRLMSGIARLSDAELLALSERDPIIYPGASSEAGDRAVVSDGLFLSVDLAGRSFVGYRAKKSTGLLDLDLKNAYEVGDYWERVEPSAGKLILGAGEFYLLVSRERVRIPPDYAAEMAAYDPTAGELRTHYAGFFDPGFGDVSDGAPGTPAVLEVRAHDVPFSLEHGQRLCKLTFERMAARPDELYGEGIGSRYQRQGLALGRQFRAERMGVPRAGPRRKTDQSPLRLVPDRRPEPLPVTARE
ncbi:MAG TPA: 2'-deoxycytidine 5'-triphosphate deaminase [Candidatus Limnocylindrales bacterium]|nr:2'-deoxycytidine 5'-triphosphate deaminase [Candidatus Limnocylindrales bacterium]